MTEEAPQTDGMARDWTRGRVSVFVRGVMYWMFLGAVAVVGVMVGRAVIGYLAGV